MPDVPVGFKLLVPWFVLSCRLVLIGSGGLCRWSEREQNGSRFVESNMKPPLYTTKFQKHPRNSFYCAPPCMSLVSRRLPPIEQLVKPKRSGS
jgi:hypothetical protein